MIVRRGCWYCCCSPNVRVSSQARETIGRGERRTAEQHHDEEEPALFYGICSRRARQVKGEKNNNIGMSESI